VRLIKIFLWLGYALLSSAALMMITALVGIIALEIREAGLMALLSTVSALVGALMITGGFKAASKESDHLFLPIFRIRSNQQLGYGHV
jgi:dsRNA-specific ribonuclease